MSDVKGSIGEKRKPDSQNSNQNTNQIKQIKRIKTEVILKDKSLPIFSYEKEIVESVKKFQTTIVVGETGSGKSTQLPQILLDNGLLGSNKKVVCTQPRRVAAITIAMRVSKERNKEVGEEVGYSVRFEDKTSDKTRIKYATDGVLLRECMSDPELRNYDIVILDEAHERSLQTDILMGLLKQVQEKRPELRIIIMSATLQVELFSSYFQNTSNVIIPGRQYPVQILYTRDPEPDYVDAALLTCLQIHEEEESGGVLVFLPGLEDIESLTQLLMEQLPTINRKNQSNGMIDKITSSKIKKEIEETNKPIDSSNQTTEPPKEVGIDNLYDFVINPLYAAMPPEDQLKVFQPVKEGIRKFILATNIAETSVTISGIKYVVDVGYVKTRLVHPETGIEMLKILPVSKSQANQRAGRAGRECPGKCFRLYTEHTYEELEVMTTPEIQRINISQVILQLKALGVASPARFPFISPPPEVVLRKSLELLLYLGALDKTQQLTQHGKYMAMLPLSPNFAHLLIKSKDLNCISEALTIVSLLSTENLFLQPYKESEKLAASHAHRNFSSYDGDFITMLNIYNQWKKSKFDKVWAKQHYLNQRSLSMAQNIRDQLSHILTSKLKFNVEISCTPNKEPFLRCILLGLSLNVAQRMVTNNIFDSKHSSKNSNDNKASNSQGTKVFSFSTPNSSSNTLNNSLTRALIVGKQDQTQAPYRTLRGNQPVHIHPSSVLFAFRQKKLPDFIVYSEILTTSKQYMRNISVIEVDWLTELFPQLLANNSTNQTQPTSQKTPVNQPTTQNKPWLKPSNSSNTNNPPFKHQPKK